MTYLLLSINYILYLFTASYHSEIRACTHLIESSRTRTSSTEENTSFNPQPWSCLRIPQGIPPLGKSRKSSQQIDVDSNIQSLYCNPEAMPNSVLNYTVTILICMPNIKIITINICPSQSIHTIIINYTIGLIHMKIWAWAKQQITPKKHPQSTWESVMVSASATRTVTEDHPMNP